MSTPQMIVGRLQELMRESGLSRREFEALAQVERTALWKISTNQDDQYLPNLGTCLAIVLACARLKKPQLPAWKKRLSPGETLAWAESTLAEVEALMQAHEEARKFSRRHSTSEHRAIRRDSQEPFPPATPITGSRLPDWITSESM